MQDENLIRLKLEQRVPAKVGRPNADPFQDKMVEEDFARRAAIMVSRYFDASPENTKKPFVLPGGVRLGKTAFWAFLYHYYTEPEGLVEKDFCPLFPGEKRPFVLENIDHFLQLLRDYAGRNAVGDRGATSKVIYNLYDHRISTYSVERISPAGLKTAQKYRVIYQTILKCWFDAF